MRYSSQFEYEMANPFDNQDDTRPTCHRCGEHFTPASGEPDEYCTASCWHLGHIGSMKKWFYQLVEQSTCQESAIKKMSLVWFPCMTDSTVERWKRAIKSRFDAKELAETA